MKDSWEIQLAKVLGSLCGESAKGFAWGFGVSLSAAVVYLWLIAHPM